MNEFTSDQLKRTTKLLIDCAPFSNETQLRTLFIDPRIRPWQHQIPSQPENYDDLIKRTITLLIGKRNRERENGLVLFLEVLADNIDEEDFCHGQIKELALELKPISRPPEPPTANSQQKKLYAILKDRFDDGEIRDLCFELSVKYQDLPGSTTKDKMRELILFMDRRNKLDDLVSAIQEARPKVPMQIQVVTATVQFLQLTLEGASDKWTLRGTNESDEAISKVNIILQPPPAVVVRPNKIQLGIIQARQTKQADASIVIRPNQTATEDSYSLPFEVIYATPNASPKRYKGEFYIPASTNRGISR